MALRHGLPTRRQAFAPWQSGWGDRPARVVYEPTGPYHAAFERRFSGKLALCKLALCKVNPLQARRFAQSKGARARTDAVDSRILAEMGAAFGLVADRPIDQNQRDLKELQIARTALVKDRTRLKNRLQMAGSPGGRSGRAAVRS